MRNRSRIHALFDDRGIVPSPLTTAGLAGAVLLAPVMAAFAQDTGAGAGRATQEGSQIEALAKELDTGEETRHEIGASVDYLYGLGDSLLLNQFSFADDPNNSFAVPEVASGDRRSHYVGAAVSYSWGQAWFFDFSYLRGTSSADVVLDMAVTGNQPTVPATFSLDDDWYQLYARYSFPRLRKTPYSLYARVGFSLVDASLEARDTQGSADAGIAPGQLYEQRTEYVDYIGNVGIGAGVTIAKSEDGRFRLGLQMDVEGFYGSRSLDTQEFLTESLGVFGPSVGASPSLYGALGRLTARFDYALQKSGLLHGFADLGMQVKYTLVDFERLTFANGTVLEGDRFGELLWGPYVRLGLSYRF
jgi:hypothetical protein